MSLLSLILGFCIIYLKLLSQADEKKKEKIRKERNESQKEKKGRTKEGREGGRNKKKGREKTVFPVLRVSRQSWLVCINIIKSNVLISWFSDNFLVIYYFIQLLEVMN